MSEDEPTFSSVELCAGAGGQAVGLHQAGFKHRALIEIDDNACDTLNLNVTNSPDWKGCEVLKEDLTELKPDTFASEYDVTDLDLLAGGVPCPPFSSAGRQLGEADERDLFPVALEWIRSLQPKAVMIENVRGLLEPPSKFEAYRDSILEDLIDAGYAVCGWRIIEACDYGVPQLRPRAILVAMKKKYALHFRWPEPAVSQLVTVGEALAESMERRFGPSGKEQYKEWLSAATGIAPTLVGGSKKHGGADLGPTRAKEAWRKLGIDGHGVANEPEALIDADRDLYGPRGPKLTVTQAAIIQGFPDYWRFSGRKTAAYRQVGNAFPPPVARAVGERIKAALIAGLGRNPELPSVRQGDCVADVLFDVSSSSVPEPTDRSRDRERASVG